MSGAFFTGFPAWRHRRAASIEEWHPTTPELRQLQFATTVMAGDTRTVARNLTRCMAGTSNAVLRNPVTISTPLHHQRQRF